MTFKHAAAGWLGGHLLDALFATTRYTSEGESNYEQFTQSGQPVIYATWHGRLLPLAYQRRDEGVVALISASADGEYLARLLGYWGFHSVRGSSSRQGSEALRELLRQLRAGRSLAITPDGPRGPLQKLKPGVLVAAQLSGAPIIPTTSAADRAWWPGKWDRFLIPKPYASIRVRYGEPFFVPRSLSAPELEKQGLEVEATLNRMMAELDVA
ncbi:MAG TPA: lysophospholipid acyltransferase family protein [Longimicrobiales bacterium]|nr:lysophospholipid acyltransferase family protein [Longimicrobiales bacterium]